MASSIGSIFVDFTARTAGLETGTKQASAMVRGFGAEVSNTNAQLKATDAIARSFGSSSSEIFRSLNTVASSFAARLVVVRGLMAGLSEISHVIRDTDEIAGLSQETVMRMEQLRQGFSDIKSFTDRTTANILSWFATAGDAIGDLVVILQEGNVAKGKALATQADVDLMKQTTDMWKQTPEYQRQVVDMQNKLTDAIKAGAIAADTLPQKIRDLQTEAAAFQRNAAAGALDPLEALRQQVQAQKDLNEAAKLGTQQIKELYDAETKLDAVKDRSANVEMSPSNMADMYKSRIASLESQFASLQATAAGDPEKVAQEVTVVNALAQSYQGLYDAQKKMHDGVDILRNQFVSGFQGMSSVITDWLTGSKANFRQWAADTVKGIISEFIKLAVLNPILNSIFAGVKGYTAQSTVNAAGLIAGFLADGGPASQGNAYVVGEEGPEVFIPGTSGSVIPNGSLSSIGDGGGKGGDINQTINIGGGVSRQELMSILPKVVTAARAAVVDATRRGGPYASAFGTG